MKCKKSFSKVYSYIVNLKKAIQDIYNLRAKAQQVNKISTVDLVNRIFNFCQAYCGVKMYPYQEQFSRRIILSVLKNDGETLTALFARQMGKFFINYKLIHLL